MRLALADQEDPMTVGFISSIIFHIFILLAIVFGVPSFFEPEMLPEPLGIEAAIVSDITAAPKAQKLSNKKPDKPKEQPAPEKEKPKAETPPPAPPALAAPPPPAPEQQAVVIPDPTQKPEEPKKETKKAEDKPKKKEEKKQDQELDALLNSVLKDQPAPEPEAKPKKKAAQPPAEPTSGPQTELVSEVPFSASEEDSIRAAIESKWNIPLGLANIETYTVMLRLYLNPDGTVTKIDIVDPQSDQGFRTLAESARRAVLVAQKDLGRLPTPADKYKPTIIIRWNMALICAQHGC